MNNYFRMLMKIGSDNVLLPLYCLLLIFVFEIVAPGNIFNTWDNTRSGVLDGFYLRFVVDKIINK